MTDRGSRASDTFESPPVSVIIPLGPLERNLGRLLGDLLLLPRSWELLMVTCPQNGHRLDRGETERALPGRTLLWLEAPTGRAAQMNAGARAAQGEFLWFLHADSGFGPRLAAALKKAQAGLPDALIYCGLVFMPDGAGPVMLNQWGAELRSRWLGVPFGDQGFCLRRTLFWKLGGYCDAPYGEDHLLVWRARRAGVKLHHCGQPLLTSARKYRQAGWGRLTLRYQWLWLRQALPQFWLWCRGR